MWQVVRRAVVGALIVLSVVGGVPAQAAAPVVITSPADGSSHAAHYTGPLTVDFTGGDLGAYELAVTGPAGYEWDGSWNFDGSQTTASWPLPSAVHAGSYTATVTAPDLTTAATSSFSIDPAVLGSSASPTPFFPFERDGYRDGVHFYFLTNFAGDATVRVVNALGRAIRIKDLGRVAASSLHSWTWNGLKDDGARVSPGAFRLHVVIVGDGRKVRGEDIVVRARAMAPKVERLGVSPSPFYPLERDGYRDDTTVTFATNVRASDTIRIRAPGGRIVRLVRLGMLRGRGHLHAWRWNGTNNAGATVATGRYLVKVVSVYFGQKVVSPWRAVVVKKRSTGGGGGGGGCTPGYSPCLVDHGGADYDCFGGSGNGPYFTAPGVIYRVTGSDPYGLDADNDGLGCEQG
jgi:flagellar hook assembly protein FlgD